MIIKYKDIHILLNFVLNNFLTCIIQCHFIANGSGENGISDTFRLLGL